MNSTSSPPSQASRPLLVRFGALGDMVLLTPLIRQLAARFDSPVDLLSSGPWTLPLLQGQPGVGDIMIVGSRRRTYWLSPDQHRAVRWLRARGAGPAWFADANAVGRGLLSRAGFADEWIVDADNCPRRTGEHTLQRWWRFAAQTPSALAATYPPVLTNALPGCQIEVSEAQRVAMTEWLQRRGLDERRLLLIQAGNKRTMRSGRRRRATNTKYWPEENWAAVIRGMRDSHPAHALVLLGTGHEVSYNRDIMRRTGVADIHNVADDLPIPRLLALLQHADSLLSVDSGPAHVAAAVGCPVVDLFGSASVDEYRPWGAAGTDVKCLTGSIDGQPDMGGIRVSTVLDAWRSLRPRQ